MPKEPLREAECGHCEGDAYPQYGVAPHDCYYKLGKPIGGSRLLAKDQWPENFVEDTESPGEGIWYCPECKKGMPRK